MITKEEVLNQCTIDGNVIKLPNIQLDRKVYQDVAKSLGLIGGKWKGGRIAGFVFQSDPTDLLNDIKNGGSRNLKKEFQYFPTPESLARRLVEFSDLSNDDLILEPSAGQGAIIKEINKVVSVIPDCYELMDVNISILNKSGLQFNLIGTDFLKNNGKMYNKIIANPPFSKKSRYYPLI